MTTKILPMLLLLLTPLAMAQTAEELRNMETLEKWGEVWLNGNFDLVKDIVNPVYRNHQGQAGSLR